MRYWVYINDKVIEKPFEEGELASIPGFNSNTLICKETPAEGETQDWVPAKNLIAAYRQPAPPPPPTKQNIEKFTAPDQQEKQSTILSSNIFGSDDKINLYTSSNTTDPTQTESISPQEQSAFEDDIFNDAQTTEVVSIDDVKEIDVDTHISQNSESEEDILKTAIRTLITPEKTHSSDEQSFQAIDIAHNRNIDLSEPQEENIDKLVSTIKEENGTTNTSEEQIAETETQNAADAKLTLLGASKTGLNHLFAVDDNIPQKEESQETPVETPAEEPASQEEQAETQETPAETPAEEPAQQEKQAETQETPAETPVEEVAPQEEQAETQETPAETPAEQPASQEEQAETQETPAETPAEQPASQEEQAETQETPAETPVEEVAQQAEQAEQQQEDNNTLEEEFMPEEEISLDDDDIIVTNLNDDKDVLTKEEPSAKEQEVLKELVADKEEDLKLAKQDEEELEEAFKTAPALVAELAQEKMVEDVIQEPNNILEPSVEIQPNEEVPMTLDELTGRIPTQEENQAEEIVPAEVHPDVIVEEVKEESPAETPEENKEENKEPQPEQDNFLNTFSSDIETVFLDQPTAFISDYIPPEATKDLGKELQQEAEKEAQGDILDIKSSQGQHQVQNVRRVKPAAIKTVPMVDGEQVDPFSKTQIKRFEVAEEAKAKIEERNKKLTFVIILVLAILAVLLLVGLIGLVAQIGFFPKDLSPIHTFAAKISHKNANSAEGSNTKLTPEELALQDLKDAEKLRINKIISEVKNYKLMEGITLEEKVKLLHPTIYNTLKWEAAQENDLTYYTIQVSSPANEAGYSQVTYSFRYNTVTYTVEATNIDSNNVLIAPFKQN